MLRRNPTTPSLLPALIAPIALIALGALGACASSAPRPTAPGIYDPSLEDAAHAKDRAAREQADFQRALVQIDQALDSYVQALSSDTRTQRQQLERLDKLLRQLVDPQRWSLAGSSGRSSERVDPHRVRKLIALAGDSSDRRGRGIALAALAFADGHDVMPVIVQGAQLEDEFLVHRAVLGLALLKDPRTPPLVVARVLENATFHEQGRIQAAWALYELQQNTLRGNEIPPVWMRVLADPDETHPMILATAVRGLGATRDPQYADAVAPFLEYPVAKVRENAAVALGRMNAQEHYEGLIRLLEPGETNQNVRLVARKALQQLAGQVDRGYDVKLWRREFERTGQ